MSPFAATITFAAGLMVGIVCFYSALNQADICVGGITAIAGGHNLFANTLIQAAFPEFYAILSLLAAILMGNLI